MNTYIHTYIHIGNKQIDIIMQEECGHNYCSNNLTEHFDWSLEEDKEESSQAAGPALLCLALPASYLPETRESVAAQSVRSAVKVLTKKHSLSLSLSLSLARSLAHSLTHSL